ncbi:MAG: 2-amino-4-hydroxy-6-hydroxymethyldihydropteridine diphosphokinase [Halieaceae bacterium]|jgi:2-amino-4-hydroxy-6-hydroxymethyldihydropteridine diphosphokinase|nr:2-amino-4-hydroxy-6-hydroxymethyldihydropteridine diphosphokinase [Halieaceae bacterium]
MIQACIGLGSNLQEPLQQLRRALLAMARLPASRLVQVSSAYRSAAVGPGEQPEYLNAAALLETSLEPGALLQALQRIERSQGRVRTIRWGPRTIDLDILLYGDLRLVDPTLTIPHPALALRNFVLYPLLELCGPNRVLPDGEDLATLTARCPQGDLVKTGLQLTGDAINPGDTN